MRSTGDGRAPPRRVLHRELLSQAVTNLIDNALRIGAGGGDRNTAACARDGAAIEVEDRGPGIAADDRDEALRRFGRLDPPAAARRGAGAGAGRCGGAAPRRAARTGRQRARADRRIVLPRG